MRKIKTKGLKFKVKPVERGPRYAVALQAAGASARRTKDALLGAFEINDALAEVVLKSTPVVLIRDLDLETATRTASRLRGSGDFRVWLESAASRMKQMTLKFKEVHPESSDGEGA
jgi:hypothetical protein